MSSPITVETAKVYRAAGRRYFTKRGAVMALARALIKKHCYCSEGDYVTPGETCHYHAHDRDGSNGFGKVYPRLVRFIKARIARASNPSAEELGNGK